MYIHLNKYSINFFIALTILLTSHSYSQSVVDSTKIVRVLTFNIYHGETMKGDFNLDVLSNVIKKVNPDLVALQEVDFKTNRAKGYDLVTELGLRTKLAPIFGKAMAFDGGEYGEGVLSKYSFLSTKNHALAARKDKEPRAALEVNVTLKSGDTIRFVGTHLDHTKDPIDRINQAKQLNAIFSENDTPTILAGDLNAKPDSKAMQILFEKWQPSFLNFEPTIPSNGATSKIDYILFRPAHKWKVIKKEVICDEVASDHCAVLSVLQLID